MRKKFMVMIEVEVETNDDLKITNSKIKSELKKDFQSGICASYGGDISWDGLKKINVIRISK